MNIFRFFERRRYFACFYAYTSAHGWGSGRIGISAEGHVNALYVENYLREQRGLTGVSLTNVIEMSKRDYDAFFAEAE